MIRTTRLMLIALCALAVSIPAQQTGSPDRDYTINLNGFAQTSPVATILNTGAPASLGTPTFFNRYDTNDPNQPIIWAMADAVQIGSFTSPLNSVDLSPAGFAIILDGTIPSPLSFWLHTDAGGKFNISLPVLGINNGGSKAFAMAHVSPSSADGFYVSQAHDVFFDTTSSLAAGSTSLTGSTTTLFLGLDDSTLRNIGFNFDFYGTTYTQVWVGSNGYVTFGAPDTSYLPSVSGLVTGPPRIAAFWTDLDPSSGGTIKVKTTTSPAGGNTMKIVWQGVPGYLFGPGGGETATFAISLRENSIGTPAGTTGSVRIDYGSVTIPDGLAAIAHGSGIIFNNQPLNWTQGPHTITGAHAYETFGVSNPFDMKDERIIVNLDINGFPTLQS